VNEGIIERGEYASDGEDKLPCHMEMTILEQRQCNERRGKKIRNSEEHPLKLTLLDLWPKRNILLRSALGFLFWWHVSS
jgi:hypothetical protein